MSPIFHGTYFNLKKKKSNFAGSAVFLFAKSGKPVLADPRPCELSHMVKGGSSQPN